MLLKHIHDVLLQKIKETALRSIEFKIVPINICSLLVLKATQV